MANPALIRVPPTRTLSVDEIARTVTILREDRSLGPGVRFVSIALHEPPKTAVLAFSSQGAIDRESFIMLLDRHSSCQPRLAQPGGAEELARRFVSCRGSRLDVGCRWLVAAPRPTGGAGPTAMCVAGMGVLLPRMWYRRTDRWEESHEDQGDRVSHGSGTAARRLRTRRASRQ
jgi:Copper amine oxidase, N2 domain